MTSCISRLDRFGSWETTKSQNLLLSCAFRTEFQSRSCIIRIRVNMPREFAVLNGFGQLADYGSDIAVVILHP